MTRKKCLEKLKNGDKKLHHIYWTNYNNAKRFFKPITDIMRVERPNVKIHLHHIEVNDTEYEKWDTVVPLFNDEHAQIHCMNKTEEQRRKISEALKGVKKGKFTNEHRKNLSISHMGNTQNRNRKWWTNGAYFKFQFECPEGYWKGAPGINQYSKKEAA